MLEKMKKLKGKEKKKLRENWPEREKCLKLTI